MFTMNRETPSTGKGTGSGGEVKEKVSYLHLAKGNGEGPEYDATEDTHQHYFEWPGYNRTEEADQYFVEGYEKKRELGKTFLAVHRAMGCAGCDSSNLDGSAGELYYDVRSVLQAVCFAIVEHDSATMKAIANLARKLLSKAHNPPDVDWTGEEFCINDGLVQLLFEKHKNGFEDLICMERCEYLGACLSEHTEHPQLKREANEIEREIGMVTWRPIETFDDAKYVASRSAEVFYGMFWNCVALKGTLKTTRHNAPTLEQIELAFLNTLKNDYGSQKKSVSEILTTLGMITIGVPKRTAYACFETPW
jgi:hypothetical protein